MNRVTATLVTIYFAAHSLGCLAMLADGSDSFVQFDSEPSGATVTIGSRELKTPAMTRLDARQDYYLVKFSKPGYRDEYVDINSLIADFFWVSVLFISGPLEYVSLLDGSPYELKPNEVFVTMEEAPVVP